MRCASQAWGDSINRREVAYEIEMVAPGVVPLADELPRGAKMRDLSRRSDLQRKRLRRAVVSDRAAAGVYAGDEQGQNAQYAGERLSNPYGRNVPLAGNISDPRRDESAGDLLAVNENGYGSIPDLTHPDDKLQFLRTVDPATLKILQEIEMLLIGQLLADKLNLKVGDAVNLLVTTSNGDIDEQLFTVRGIFTTRTPGFDENTILMPLAKAQAITATENHVSTIFVLLQDLNRPDLLHRPCKETIKDPHLA